MNRIEEIKKLIIKKMSNISSLEELQNIKSEFLGKKGLITEAQGMIKEISNDEKKEFGMKVNEVRLLFNTKYEEIKNKLEEEKINKKLREEAIDITLPSEKIETGSLHPFTRIIMEVEDLFVSMGYDVVDGNEIETDEYCFKRLNVPLGHPARDMQDTFYITEEYLLRTQTSTAQAHTMEENKEKGPIRIICPGKVYRRDDDATHSHQFGQVEGLVVDKDISLADLKGTLEIFAKKLLGENTKVRFRPSYFPFTEPSVEVDLSCFKCGGKGCALCKQTGWIEVLGAGMVHPDVLRMGGYDPEVYTGFAFGTGLDRLAMFKYNIPDIRYLYTNDVRFLKEFDRKDEE
ncbi:MAG: phenylalanine--tRNA ligase subunit alpha [Bacilli bacterium]